MSNIAIIENTNYPEDLCCPIGHDLFVDPVIIKDGHTYEKELIIRWLEEKKDPDSLFSFSPLTNQKIEFRAFLPYKYLIPNILVKKLIEKWKEDNLIKKEFYLDNLIMKYKENDELITCDNIKLKHIDFTYEGSILDGEFSGNGILTKNNDKYDGEFLNNKKHGKGRMIYENGDIYEGVWNNDCCEECCEITYNNGDIYKGCLNNNKFNGDGIMIYKNGSIYNGEWVNNHKHGQGIMDYENGNTYNGKWINNKKHGKGNMIYENGDTYDGEWLDDIKSGEGIYTFANKDIYNGNWLNDNKHGKGKLEYKNGVIYDGEFSNNKINGKGIMKYKNGNIYNGIFKESDEGIDFEGVYKGKIINNNKLDSIKEEEINNVFKKISDLVLQKHKKSNIVSESDLDSDSDSDLSSSIDSI
jgi:hypothetical protein